MADLAALSGLPVKMEASGQLSFGPDVVIAETGVRRLWELAPVALAADACRDRDDIVYYMYNGIHRVRDAERLRGVPLRYELTLIPPRRIGDEFVKTHGHIHNSEQESGLSYAEVCEVLVGTAHFVLQTLDPDEPSASVAYLVEVKPGEKIIIPPGYDHLTINPGDEPLLFSDVIALSVHGIYDRFRASRGAAYLEVAHDGQMAFEANPAYLSVPDLQRVKVHEYPAHNLTCDIPLYTALIEGQGRRWDFLVDPGRFWHSFPELEEIFKYC
jgi:glucose-6-phosphate isomerase, archaeal